MSTGEDIRPSVPDAAQDTERVGASGTMASSAPLAVERGTQIDRYVVMSRIGAGGMGDVFSAYDPELDRRVALKLLSATHRCGGGPEEAEARLLREAQALARLSHPNVVVVHDAGTFRGHVFVAMEFIEGITLRAWLREQPRAWAEVFDVMLPAARGLSAAHAAGIIHRDFKPANVMIRIDGAVRVLDFGLARRVATPSASAVVQGPLSGVYDSLDEQLTRTGVVSGTPAYMAPEQFAGGELDERTDQFAFCVVLYEALYGERPFPGKEPTSLSKAVRAGQLRPAPAGVKVPPRLRRCLLRGLSPKPNERYPSMAALLEELQTASRPPWRRAAPWGVGALGVGLVGLALAVPKPDADSPCADASTKLDGAWDETTRQAGAQAFAAAGLEHAEQTWTRVKSRIDEYAMDWTAQYTDACEATRVRKEQSDDLMDRRMSCLDRRRTELAVVADLFANADAKVVNRAVDSAGKLSGLEACEADNLLRDQVPPPSEAQADAVAELSDELARIRVLKAARKLTGLDARSASVVARAREVGYAPTLGRALVAHGSLLMANGKFEEAIELLEECLLVAEAAGDDEVKFGARTTLATVTGAVLARVDEGLRHARFARAVSGRIVIEGESAGLVDLIEGMVAYEGGDYTRSRQLLEAALHARIAEYGEEHEAVAAVLINLGAVVIQTGDHEQGREIFERALSVVRPVYGPRSPIVATTLNNLSLAYLRLDQVEEARGTATDALDIWEEALPPQHPDIATGVMTLGSVKDRLGKYEEALALYERARDLNVAARGEDDPVVATAEANIAYVLTQLGRHDKARGHAKVAVEIIRARLGDEHPSLANYNVTYAVVLLETDGRSEAIDRLRDAIAIYDAHPGMEAKRAEAQLVLAGALWSDASSRPAARALATTARQTYVSLGSAFEDELAEVDAWLADHADPA